MAESRPASRQRRGATLRALRRDWMLYALLIPGILYVVLFHYIPMFGISIAFHDYSVVSGTGGLGGPGRV